MPLVDADERITLSQLVGDERDATDVSDQLDDHDDVRVIERDDRRLATRLEHRDETFTEVVLDDVRIDRALVAAPLDPHVKTPAAQPIDQRHRRACEGIDEPLDVDAKRVLDRQDARERLIEKQLALALSLDCRGERLEVVDATDEHVPESCPSEPDETGELGAHVARPSFVGGDEDVPVEVVDHSSSAGG